MCNHPQPLFIELALDHNRGQLKIKLRGLTVIKGSHEKDNEYYFQIDLAEKYT